MNSKQITKEEILLKRHKVALSLYGTIWPSELTKKRKKVISLTNKILVTKYGEPSYYI